MPSDSAPVGYVLKRFPRFSETFILNEMLALEARGRQVEAFSLLNPPEEPRHARLADLKARVNSLPEMKPEPLTVPAPEPALVPGKTREAIASLCRKAGKVAARARSRGITHLHAHFGSDATTVALLAARALGGSFSFTAHAKDIYHLYVSEEDDRAMRHAKLREAAFAVTVSDYNARLLAQICPEARIHRIHNGIDLSAFRPVQALDQDPNHLIAVGRFVEKKGFDTLIDACAILKDAQVPFRLSLVGSGPLEDALRLRIAEHGLGAHVALPGPLPQESLVGLMGTAGIAVLPCRVTETGDRDGLPTVLLEAAALGLPIVTTDVTGCPEIVETGETGFTCRPDDPAAIARALGWLLMRPERARQMGRAGRALAEQRFDLHRNVAALDALFAEHVRQPEVA